MTNPECELCKKSYTQGGRCMDNKRNCLMFEEEPRGKMKRAKILLPFDFDGVYGTVKCFNEVTLIADGCEFQATVIKITEVNIDKAEIYMEIDYHEKDWEPKSERVKKFKIVK